MAIRSVTILVTFCFTQQLYLGVESAMIREYYDIPLFDEPNEVAPPELDESMPRVLSPSMTADDGLATILPPSSPQLMPTQTSVEQSIEDPVFPNATTYDQPMTITPPPIATNLTIGQSAAQAECTPWPWGCGIYYQVRCRYIFKLTLTITSTSVYITCPSKDTTRIA